MAREFTPRKSRGKKKKLSNIPEKACGPEGGKKEQTNARAKGREDFPPLIKGGKETLCCFSLAE